MSRIAYVRVSTRDQSLDRQVDLMAGQDIDKTFSEKISGATANRPELKAMLQYVREGDTVVIESISRLARSTRDLLKIVDQLQAKGVAIVSLKESIDTSSPTGRFVLSIFGALYEMDRDMILERQREGIMSAQERGKRFGRPKIVVPDNFVAVVAEWQAGQIKAVEAMKTLGLTKPTFYRLVKERINPTASAPVVGPVIAEMIKAKEASDGDGSE